MRVLSLHVYPVKSCVGFSPEEWRIDDTGFKHDREWMLTDVNGMFLSQRKDPILATIRVLIKEEYLQFHVGEERVFSWPIMMMTGARCTVQVHDDRLLAFDQGNVPARNLSDIVGRPVRLVKKSCLFERFSPDRLNDRVQVGLADAYPLLVTTTTSLDDLNKRLAQPVPMDRFRPNIVIDDVDEPFAEDQWGSFMINHQRFAGRNRCTRCSITTTNQRTGDRSKEPLATLLSYRVFPGSKSACFGLNVDHLTKGQIQVGDPVTIESNRDM